MSSCRSVLAAGLLSTLLATFSVSGQVVLPRVGVEIDSVERAYFHLFPRIPAFGSATLHRIDSARYEFFVDDGRGGEVRLPLAAGAFADLRSYLVNYERIVRVESDTLWSVRPYRWGELLEVVDPAPWLRAGAVVFVTLRDGTRTPGQLLAVAPSGLLLGNRNTPFDPADTFLLYRRNDTLPVYRWIDSGQIGAVEEFDPYLVSWNIGGMVVGVAAGAALTEGGVVERLQKASGLGLFAGALVGSIVNETGSLRVRPGPSGRAPFTEVQQKFGLRAGLPERYPPGLIDSNRIVHVLPTGLMLQQPDTVARRLSFSIGLSFAFARLAAFEDYQFSTPISGISRGALTFGLQPAIVAEYTPLRRWGVGVELMPPATTLGVRGDHGEGVTASGYSVYAIATPLTLEDRVLPFEIDMVVGYGNATARVFGWMDGDRRTAADEEVEGVVIGSGSAASMVYGARLRTAFSRPSSPSRLSASLQAVHRSYPTVRTTGLKGSGSGELLPHDVDASGWVMGILLLYHF